MKDFLSGKKELVDFKDENHNETIWTAINDGEIDFEVLGTFGKRGGQSKKSHIKKFVSSLN